MSIREVLLPEFDVEMEATRRTLERVPEDNWNFKPHEKSGTMGWLAGHVATIPGWAVETIQKDSLDIAPEGAPPFRPPEPSSRKELLELFDKSVAGAREAIAGASDDHLQGTWTLLSGGKPLFSQPRIMLLRRMVINHLIHHRAQLGVYLRLTGVAVPAIYGPSADEAGFR